MVGSDGTMLQRCPCTRTNAIMKRVLLRRLRLMVRLLMALRRMRIGWLRSIAWVGAGPGLGSVAKRQVQGSPRIAIRVLGIGRWRSWQRRWCAMRLRHSRGTAVAKPVPTAQPIVTKAFGYRLASRFRFDPQSVHRKWFCRGRRGRVYQVCRRRRRRASAACSSVLAMWRFDQLRFGA